MTIKEPWQKGYEQESPSDLDSRITMAAHSEMKAQKKSWFFAPWALLPAGAAAAIAIGILVWPRQEPGNPELAAAREISEMLKEEAMLRDLEVLRQADMWERIEREPWATSKI